MFHTQVCPKCNTEKPIEDFPKHIGHKSGYDSRCRQCIKEAALLRRKLLKTAPPKPDVCDLCHQKPTKSLCLDHDHETGEFRGWLCEPCNLGLGGLGDNYRSLSQAIVYTMNYPTNERTITVEGYDVILRPNSAHQSIQSTSNVILQDVFATLEKFIG